MTRQRRSALFAPLEERVLAIVVLRTEREWYRSELARKLGVRASSLQRPLARLVAADVVCRRRSGNRVYYRANTENPLFPDIRGLLAKTSGLAWVLHDALRGLHAKIAVAFVYGSIASGEEVATSDVDLFVVGKVRPSELVPCLREAGKQLGREVNPNVYSRAEFARRVAAKERFVRSVLDKPKLYVVGTEDDLRRASRPKENRR
ncbi:nucleotidyltransferase domain-containing protein [Candidatus Eisenbacteria bacterium]|uniref:Nucleotidyltransferase domain-containing protein n=1 Tax=Eiseniibacteriota bacterium TaxID=2212470 RepID=A0ABV6YK35_UNCEI